MKTTLAILTALLLAGPGRTASPLRFEAEGVRVGAELVSGSALVMKGDAAPVLVSGAVVESLGAPVAVSLGSDRDVVLDAGVRLSRQGETWTLSTHGPELAIAADGRSIDAARSISFKTTEKGFDLGALGTLESTSFVAKVAGPKAPAVAAVAQGQGNPVSPELARQKGSRTLNQTPVWGNGDPSAMHAPAEKYSLADLTPVSP